MTYKTYLTPAYISYFISYKYPCFLYSSCTDLCFSAMPSSFLPQGLCTCCSLCLDCTSPKFLKAWLLIIVACLVSLLSCGPSLASPYKSHISSWSSLISSLCLTPFTASTSFRCSYVAAVSHSSRGLFLFFNILSPVSTAETNIACAHSYLLH